MKEFFINLITCSKTGGLSSMRLINLIGSLILLLCIFIVVIKPDAKEHDLMYLIGGLLGLNGSKVLQSNFEKKK